MKSFLYGMKKSIPVFFGFLPVAITFAIMAMGSGFMWYEALGMSVFVFAGASQIMAVGMISAGAGMLSVVLATFVLNLRHFIMSTCIFKKIRVRNVFLKLLLAFSVTDEGFALVTTEDDSHCDVPFALGIITVTYLSWIFGTVIGVVASGILPAILADSFAVALYALFIALIVPDVKGDARLLLTVLITATLNTLLCIFMPSSWAVIISTLAGAALGTFLVKDKDSGESGEPDSEELDGEVAV